MCLAIPSKVVEIDDLKAVVDVCGARREVSLLLMHEEVMPGDYVLVHAGFAMQKVDREVAAESRRFFGSLVEGERARDEGLPGDAEVADILERGTISWEKTPGTES